LFVGYYFGISGFPYVGKNLLINIIIDHGYGDVGILYRSAYSKNKIEKRVRDYTS